jgi:lactate dehydrogenase-like 2-hydroxyacid dehydrogenase
MNETSIPKPKTDLLLLGQKIPRIEESLKAAFNLHRLPSRPEEEKAFAFLAPSIKAMAILTHVHVDSKLMTRFPNLKIISSCSVGYDHVDARWAGEHGIVVTNTPGVLTDEVADTALGLLLCTVRALPQAERFLRAGKWESGNFPLSKSTLRGRKIGIIGLGRIGRAIAKRLEGFGVTIVYHGPREAQDVPYRYYPDLLGLASDVDTLINCTPGGSATLKMINAEVLAALGPDGVLINIGRASTVDEGALIAALQSKIILAAGLDVFWDEPRVSKELIAMENVILFPHLGSATEFTRQAMAQLVVDNLLAWDSGKAPLTPVRETPWPQVISN